MLAGIVTVITMVAIPLEVQDTAVHKDTAPPAPPTIEQIHYMAGLKTATRGVAQIRDGLNRVARTQQADAPPCGPPAGGIVRHRPDIHRERPTQDATQRLRRLARDTGEAAQDTAGLADRVAPEM